MDRPYVIMCMGASIDGRITYGPGLTMWRRHPADDARPDAGKAGEAVVAAIEATWHPQGEIMGSATFVGESDPLRELPAWEGGDPEPLYEDFLPEEVLQSTTSWGILVDGRGRGRSGYKCSNEGPGRHILHLTSRAAAPEYLAFLRRERIPYLVDGERHVDLPAALRKLRGRLGLKCVKLMGGGTLNGAMLRAGSIDEILLELWPTLIGGRATPTLADGVDLGPQEWPPLLELLSVTPGQNGYLLLHYRVRHDPQAPNKAAQPAVALAGACG
jgi:2,5-diamino-6-(ribosylamino)-4(3H)-pyrimidinone 5'-phosphate reductase